MRRSLLRIESSPDGDWSVDAAAISTKDKGDIGVADAVADLVDQGFVVLIALGEHAPSIWSPYRDGDSSESR